jgi:hypothetical protein
LLPFDEFGSAVAIASDGTIAVGAPCTDELQGDSDIGAVYVFEPKGEDTWQMTQELVPDADATGTANFGLAVAISDGVLVVGAPGDDGAVQDSGAAYVFEQIDGTWTKSAKLFTKNGESADDFGRSVSVSGTTIAVGNPNLDEGKGAVWIYEKQDGTWVEIEQLVAPDGLPGDVLGVAVALDDNVLVAGTPQDNELGKHAGSAHVFAREGDEWTHVSKLLAIDGQQSDNFGWAVDVAGDRIVAGAYKDDHSKLTQPGSAYAMSIPCAADFNCDEVLNIVDFIAFQDAFLATDPLADCNSDGTWNILDFLCFQFVFKTGCP